MFPSNYSIFALLSMLLTRTADWNTRDEHIRNVPSYFRLILRCVSSVSHKNANMGNESKGNEKNNGLPLCVRCLLSSFSFRLI